MATPPKPVPLPETKIQIPAWSQEGKEMHITATKRCLVTEKVHQEPVVPTSKNRFTISKTVVDKRYTTENCPVYEIEKCAIPTADPGLQAANVEVCAVVKVNETIAAPAPSVWTGAGKRAPEIKNRIIVRPAGCMVVKIPTYNELGISRSLVTPTGEHAPEGVVECVHTAAYVGPLEGIASVPDEQLALKVGTEEALPAEIRFDPRMHFGALWSYVEGLVQEGIANVFQGAMGQPTTPVGFNSEMQAQVYRAIQKVAPNYAQNELLPSILEAWARAPLASRTRNVLEILEERFHFQEFTKSSPGLRELIDRAFPPLDVSKIPRYPAINETIRDGLELLLGIWLETEENRLQGNLTPEERARAEQEQKILTQIQGRFPVLNAPQTLILLPEEVLLLLDMLADSRAQSPPEIALEDAEILNYWLHTAKGDSK